MADLSGNPLAQLYPQPSPGLGSDPARLLGMIGQLNQNALFQKEFRAKQAVGNAFQGAIGPDGSFDPAAAARAIKADPDAAFGAPDAVQAALSARGTNIENATKALNLGVANNSAIAGILAPYANQPGLSKEDQFNIKAKLAAAGVDPATVAAADLTTPFKTLKAAQLGAVQSMGAGNAAQPVRGAPGASGAPTDQPLASTIGAGSRTVGLPPGQAEAATTIGGASGAQAVDLGKAADTSPIRKGMLGNLEADLTNFTAGPGADWTKVAKAWANRNVLPTGMQFDPASIASQEAFGKQAEQLAQQQFQAIGGTGTDAKFGSAFKANPNDALSQLGNQGIIRLLKGNEDAIQAKNGAWQKWQAAGNPPQSYPQFAAAFNKNFDPRVYQAQYMSKEDFTKMVKTMSVAEQSKFVAALNFARDPKNGYATSPGAYYAGQ